jgi:peroxin-5
MSFLGGAECSTAANPLAQLSKHTQGDKSLQRDRLAGERPMGAGAAFRSQIDGGMGAAADAQVSSSSPALASPTSKQKKVS